MNSTNFMEKSPFGLAVAGILLSLLALGWPAWALFSEIENRNRVARRGGRELDEATWAQIIKAAESVGVETALIEACIIK